MDKSLSEEKGVSLLLSCEHLVSWKESTVTRNAFQISSLIRKKETKYVSITVICMFLLANQ